VRDVIEAVDGLATNPDAPGQVVNVGSQAEISILELAEKIKVATNSSSEIRLVPYDEAYAPGFEDMQRRVPDTTRVESLIGWKPKISLDETLASVREQLEGADASLTQSAVS